MERRTLTRFILLFVFVLTLCSCSAWRINRDDSGMHTYSRPNMLAVFMDGTNNKPHKNIYKNTNIRTLNSLVVPEVHHYYIDGVGNNFKVGGLAFGVGISRRVRYAYEFLADNYKSGDSLCIFGFSRGAYSSRILSNLIYVAGIPSLKHIESRKVKKKIIRGIYSSYLCTLDAEKRKKRVTNFIDRWNRENPKHLILRDKEVNITAMGVFETVEALGWPDKEENFTAPNKNHLYQIANVDRVFHAMSLDDNRARIFTPILYTTDEIKNSSTKDINKVVDEVWFSGAHLDVGGGANPYPETRNTTLNWMLAKMKPYNLFRKDTTIIEYLYYPAKNMQKSIAWRILYMNMNRSIDRYLFATKAVYNGGRLKVHESVIKRLEQGVVPEFKTKKNRVDWFDKYPFNACFLLEGKKRILKKDCACIDVVKNN